MKRHDKKHKLKTKNHFPSLKNLLSARKKSNACLLVNGMNISCALNLLVLVWFCKTNTLWHFSKNETDTTVCQDVQNPLVKESPSICTEI